MELNDGEKDLLTELEGYSLNKEQADSYALLEDSYKHMLLADAKIDLGLRVEPYLDGRFIILDGKYFKFEDFLFYLISIGYIGNPLTSSDGMSERKTKIASA